MGDNVQIWKRVQKCQDTKYYLLLSKSNDSNWNEIMQKWKIINNLAPRQLSLHRKAILLNAEILAKTTYIFNVHKKAFTTSEQQSRNHSKENYVLVWNTW